MEEETKQHFVELFRKAEAGDAEALALITPRITSKFSMLVESVGLTAQVRSVLSRRVAQKEKLATQLVWQLESEALVKSVAGPSPSPLEAILAEQVGLTWMALRLAEFANEASNEISFKEAYWLQSRVDSAHSRYLAAVRTLAQVRKLQIPNLVQVNIAEQQVNVAG